VAELWCQGGMPPPKNFGWGAGPHKMLAQATSMKISLCLGFGLPLRKFYLLSPLGSHKQLELVRYNMH